MVTPALRDHVRRAGRRPLGRPADGLAVADERRATTTRPPRPRGRRRASIALAASGVGSIGGSMHVGLPHAQEPWPEVADADDLTTLTEPVVSVTTPPVVEPDGSDAAERREQVRGYAEAVGLDVGETVDAVDVRALTERLGIDVPDDLRGDALERIHVAWRQTLAGTLEQLGIDHGTTVEDGDVHALAEAVGVPLDSVAPTAVAPVLDAVSERTSRPGRFATVGDVALQLPSQDVVGAGFHQATSGASRTMQPTGHDAVFDLPDRGRGTDSRSAIDVAVEPGSDVLSPVTGRVVDVMPYMLYGDHPDTRIAIAPDDDPSTVVTLLHVSDPTVDAGDRVEAGEIVARHSTEFPFASQIDAVVGRTPHVHIEVTSA